MCELVNMTVQVFLPSSRSHPTPPGHAPPGGWVGGSFTPRPQHGAQPGSDPRPPSTHTCLGTLCPSSRSPQGGCPFPELAPTAISTVLPTGIVPWNYVVSQNQESSFIRSILNGHAHCPCPNASDPGGLPKHPVKASPAAPRPEETQRSKGSEPGEPRPPLEVIPVCVPWLVA